MVVCVCVRTPEQFGMALVSLSVLCCLLLDFQLGHGAPAPASGPVFLSGQAADNVLRRHKRYNTGVFEEFQEGNLERECIEEVCDLEEAREVFENYDKTMEFWAGYVDGNQCKSSPCLNQGSCTDHLGYYTCTCPSGFTGRRCEIAIAKRCDVNNGDCMHFCESMRNVGAKCSCARGYRLLQDGVNCEAEVSMWQNCPDRGECSTLSLSVRPWECQPAEHHSSDHHLHYCIPSFNSSQYPGDFSSTNNSVKIHSRMKLPRWVFRDAEAPEEEPPIPIKRIVGGTAVIPGEIPWQVALVERSGDLFCGGSILSNQWVITAAHCLMEAEHSFFIRVGEHNINIKEGTEHDYDVLEQHMHPRYNGTLSLYNHDIALLYLKNPISFSTTVRPICIGPTAFTEALVKGSTPATVSGWGRMRFLGFTADTLLKVQVPFTGRTECKRSSSARITPFMFCAGYYDEAKDSCQGDSGGPHTNSMHDTWFLTGIVSWGEECAKQGKYGVYTRVSLYYRWINHVMGITKDRLAIDVEDPDPEIDEL
ncbi:hypothetical protein F7725_010358 [Dissostichus mawsoni]|uniref:Coagulation factor IX n=1 Tax=Dissostichus mawsoni TaxID=36200 RepID=A0A7J5XNL2_DISMA|nr:hypothetical protein F7725_010358 [Dissostichus mawsoni]